MEQIDLSGIWNCILLFGECIAALSRSLISTTAFSAPLLTLVGTLLGALIAAGVTLRGVVITNRAHEERLRIQLEEDRRQKRIDRLLTLRREVYLAAASEAVKANQYLSKLSGLDFTKPESGDGLTPLFSELTKAQLISEPDTAIHIAALNNAYAEAWSRNLLKNARRV